jgi:hypothetical protein
VPADPAPKEAPVASDGGLATLTALRAADRALALAGDDASEPKEPREKPHAACNDNGAATEPIDPRILIVARALGRLLARQVLERMRAANDNEPTKKP